jgi:hypothetical protein
MARGSFEFKPGNIDRNLRVFKGKMNALVAATVDYQGTQAVSYMKTNAKWRDRTGNARATLGAFARHSTEVHEIHLHGGVPYQIWLEVRWAGKYAIISKAVIVQGRALMAKMNRLVDRLGGGG